MGKSLAMRGLFAIVLMTMFFALALTVVGGLSIAGIWVFSWMTTIRVGKVMVLAGMGGAACFGAAAVVAWSMLPRLDRFTPPGPELLADQHPRLFAEIARIGTATNQALPRHVYLVPEVNAFVTQRGGWMGFGSRRVMGIGLPLLEVLDVSQLRAVLAHEFGHFDGGDTRLGPWIYKTRGAVFRTVHNLARTRSATSEGDEDGITAIVVFIFGVVERPFVWFGSLFMRVTQAISRAQEITADALAARVAGSASMTSALEVVNRTAPVFPHYFEAEVLPALSTGLRPPVSAGFSAFLARDQIQELVDRAQQLDEAEPPDPYDSHPSLAERVRLLNGLDVPGVKHDSRKASTLVENVDRLEAELLEGFMVGRPLRRIEWGDMAEDVYLPAWRASAEESEPLFAGSTIVDMPTTPSVIRERLRLAFGDDVDFLEPERLLGVGAQRLGCALALTLIEEGFVPVVEMAEPVRLVRGDAELEPWKLVHQYLLSEELDATEWRTLWQTLGLAELPLARSLPLRGKAT